MFKFLPIIIGCITIFSVSAMANDLLKTKNQKSSYVLGVEMGNQFLISKDDIEIESMMLGLKDVFQDKELQLSKEEMLNALMYYQDREREREQVIVKQVSDKNKKEGLEYLAQNKNKEGVITLESGLQYKVIKSGSGKVHPRKSDTVTAHYKGTLIDGTIFDSSYKRKKPIVFPVNGVLAGWTEALLKMKVGDKWQLFIPHELAYGEAGASRIGPSTTLIFDIELLEIK